MVLADLLFGVFGAGAAWLIRGVVANNKARVEKVKMQKIQLSQEITQINVKMDMRFNEVIALLKSNKKNQE